MGEDENQTGSESEIDDNESNDGSDNESGEKTEENRENIRSELKSLSFAELLKLKDELGSKVYNEALFGEDSTTSCKRKVKRASEFKRDNKNRPREVSAKKQVPLLGSVSKKKKDERPVDPRFDEKCGEFDRAQFKADYSFVNEIREKEIVELKKQLKELGKNQDEEKEKVKLVLQRMKNQNLEEKKFNERKQLKTNLKQKTNNAIKEERKPFYVSKGEEKAQALVKQYEELKKSGKLNKHREKRRKKNVARDRKKYSF